MRCLPAVLATLLVGATAFAQFDRPWRIYLVPFSHTDVGYTATVPEVIAAHEQYLDSVITYVHRTAANEEGSRFRWTIEIPWVLEHYVRDRSAARVESLMTLVRAGAVDIGAIHFSLQTDLCSNEELIRSLHFAQELRTTYNVPIRTAMIDDTPGFTWSLAQLLPKSGVLYLSVAMNSFLCDFYKTTTLPNLFALEGQDGSSVLVWRSTDTQWAYLEGGMSLAVYGAYADFENRLATFLKSQESKGYPYSEVFVNCATGDNAPPKLAIVSNVQEWNARHADAKVILATASQFFDTVAAKYGASIPTVRGDAPNWWAWVFSPSGTGVFTRSRRAQMLLPAAESFSTFASLWDPAFAYPEASLREAYINNLLIEDHNLGTWYASGNTEFWTRKTAWANAAHDTATAILARSVSAIGSLMTTGDETVVAAFNPTGWERTEVVTLSLLDPLVSSIGAFDVRDGTTGDLLPLQRTSDSTVAFQGSAIPPVGYKCFRLVPRGGQLPVRTPLPGFALENSWYAVRVDQTAGGIASIIDKSSGAELVSPDMRFNQYRFKSTLPPTGLTVSASDSGPVLQRITLRGSASGTAGYETSVVLPEGTKRIDFETVYDRLPPASDEGVDIDFHFNGAGARLRYEIPLGDVRIFEDELSGFRTKHYAANRWMNVSLQNGAHAAVLATKDASIIAANSGTFDGALRMLVQYNGVSSAYRAGTGLMEMDFALTSSPGDISAENTARFAYGSVSPLPVLVLPPGRAGPLPGSSFSFLRITPADLVMTTAKRAMDGGGVIARLFNPASHPVDAELEVGGSLVSAVQTSLVEMDEAPLPLAGGKVVLQCAPYEVKTLRLGISPLLSVPVSTERITEFALQQNFPNPFNPSTMIRFSLAEPSTVALTVTNILGQRVRVLAQGDESAPSIELRWDGRDDQQRVVPSGVYYYTLDATGRSGARFRQTRAMVFVR